MSQQPAPTVISGFDNPEDIVLIPGTDWIVTGGYAHGEVRAPRTYFVHTITHEVRPAYPGNCMFDLDRARFGDVEPPPAFSFHGLDVTRSADGVITLYQVNHPVLSEAGVPAGRESVEVFEIDLGPEGPSLRWRGGVTSPSWVNGNDVCALPEGGFALTNTLFGIPDAVPMVMSGGISGQVLEWHDREQGWSIIEGTDLSTPNGVAASPDGEHLFVAAWATRKLHRISRRDPHGDRVTIDAGAMIDNITWTHDGQLMCCGQVTTAHAVFESLGGGAETYNAPLRAVRVDPKTMEMEVLLSVDVGDRYATTALQISDTELWTGAMLDRRLFVHQIGG